MKRNHNYPYPVDITDDVYTASILALQILVKL